MNTALTRNVKKLSVGQVVYSAMCYENGTMIDDGTLYRMTEHYFRWICGNDYSGEWLRELSKKLDLKDDNIEKYYAQSHKLGVVPKYLNKLQNKLFGIECNFEELNGIDFKKGCYVGQENTARIKLKNKLSKRLLPINIIDGKLYEGESIFNNDNEIGKVLIDNDYPFALIKYLDKNFDQNVNFKTKEAFINIIKPDWVN